MPHHSALTSQLADAYIADRHRSTNRSSQTPTRRHAEPIAHRFPPRWRLLRRVGLHASRSASRWRSVAFHDTPSRPSSAKVRRVGSHVPANRTVST
jgi:hypothetical protein